MVHLLDSSETHAAMLLEYLKPGTTLKEVQQQNDEEATRIGASLLAKTVRSISNNRLFPTVSDWCKVLDRIRVLPGKQRFSDKLLDLTADPHINLTLNSTPDSLLHGDLHHDNILYDEEKGWLAIDPKGVIGPREFNAARFIQNFWNTPVTENRIHQRIEIIAEATGFEKSQLGGWAFTDYIVSNCWTLEENRKPVLNRTFMETLLEIHQPGLQKFFDF